MWLKLLMMSFIAYRWTRFLILDSFIENWRESFYEWLLKPLEPSDIRLVLDLHEDSPLQKLPMWRRKGYQLFSCPFCLSVWMAGAIVLAWDHVDVRVWLWLSVATGALIVYRIIDAEE